MRTLLPSALLASVALLLAAPAARAQDMPPDTIRVERGTVIIIDRDGPHLRGDGVLRLRSSEALRGLRGDDGPFEALIARRLADTERLQSDALRMHEGPWALPFGEPGGRLGLGRMATPEIMRQEAETQRLARAVRDAEGAERERLESELRDALDALFEAKMALREEQIEALEAELEARREQYEARRAEHEAIVDRRLRELLGEDDVLDW